MRFILFGYIHIDFFLFFLGGCVGKIFQDQLDESKTLKLSRKQLRKAFTILGSQLSEVDEALIFELLGECSTNYLISNDF